MAKSPASSMKAEAYHRHLIIGALSARASCAREENAFHENVCAKTLRSSAEQKADKRKPIDVSWKRSSAAIIEAY